MSKAIPRNIPEAEDLLGMKSEELAGYLLEHLHSIQSSRLHLFHPGNIANSIEGSYPPQFTDKINKRIREACSWLTSNGYIAPTNDQGFFDFTEKGERTREHNDIAREQVERSQPESHLAATQANETSKRSHIDFWLKIVFLIIFITTTFILLLRPSREILVILFAELFTVFLTADIRGWVSEKIPQALDRLGSVGALLITILLLLFPSEKNSPELNSNTAYTPTLTMTPSPIPSPTQSQTVVADDQKPQEKPIEPNPQTIMVNSERTGRAFNGNVSVGVNGILFGGDPLRHTVNATIRSPGYKPREVKNFEVNASIVYKADAVYEISLVEVDTFWAKFEVRRVEGEQKTMPNRNRTPN